MMYNKVFLIGRLTKDPESKVTPSGLSLARFTIAIDRIGGNRDTKVTDFINVVTWRKTAEIASRYLKKGKLVSVEGSLQIDNYEKEGQLRQWVEVICENFQMLDRITDAAPVAAQV